MLVNDETTVETIEPCEDSIVSAEVAEDDQTAAPQGVKKVIRLRKHIKKANDTDDPDETNEVVTNMTTPRRAFSQEPLGDEPQGEVSIEPSTRTSTEKAEDDIVKPKRKIMRRIRKAVNS
jgi:hypothetical protein